MTPDLLDTISLYLHIPFCQAKCHYCDFNSYAGMLGLREQYVEALRAEIALSGRRAQHAPGDRRRCRTIFFGGGTPSLLEADQVRVLLVKFVAGGRNVWHKHTFDQILVVTEGEGIVATESEEAHVRAGDVAVIPAGEKHWHGAAPTTSMAHLAIGQPGSTEILGE